MAKLSDFPKATHKAEVAKADWACAPVGITRDSEPLTQANFEALCRRFESIDPYERDWEILRFDHFKCGWLENIFVRPGSLVHEMCAQVREELAPYPCLDEELWVEYDEAQSA